jgi:hypothetical protein
MRNRVHPAGVSSSKTFARSLRDPEDGSNAFTDVKDAWMPESSPEKENRIDAAGGLVPMLAPIDTMSPDTSLGIDLPAPSPIALPGMIGGDPLPSARSQDSASHLSTPRLSARKHHYDEDKDDEQHRHPTCCVYYAQRNRCAASRTQRETRTLRLPLPLGAPLPAAVSLTSSSFPLPVAP